MNAIDFNKSDVIALYDKENGQILAFEDGMPYLYEINKDGKSSIQAWANDRKNKIGKDKFGIPTKQQEALRLLSTEGKKLIFSSEKEASISFELDKIVANKVFSPNTDEQRANNRNKAGKNRYKAMPIGNTSNQLVRYILSNIGKESFSENDWEETKKWFNYKCAYCGKSGELQIDHAIPINKEHLGEHRLGNLVPSCGRCNNNKHDSGYKEFLGDQPERIRKIEEYMESKDYRPLHLHQNAAVIKKILRLAYKEARELANRYIELIHDINS